jgi:hypothetical protein
MDLVSKVASVCPAHLPGLLKKKNRPASFRVIAMTKFTFCSLRFLTFPPLVPLPLIALSFPHRQAVV